MAYRLMSRKAHTGKINVVGIFRYQIDAYRQIYSVLIPMTGKEVIYNVERY